MTRIFPAVSYLPGMLRRSDYQPCIPTPGKLRHDGYRLIVQREGKRVRLLTCNVVMADGAREGPPALIQHAGGPKVIYSLKVI